MWPLVLGAKRAQVAVSQYQGGQSVVTVAKAVVAKSTSAGEVPHGAPATGNTSRSSRPVTVMLSSRASDALQRMETSVTETAPIGYGSSSPVVLQQLGPQFSPPTLHTVPMPKQEKPSEDIAYKRVEVMEPDGVGQTRVIGMEGKSPLEPLSKHVRGRITVPGPTGFDPVKAGLLLDSG